MVQFIPAIASAIPAIVKLFDSDERDEGVKELTGTVVKEAGKALGVEFGSKKDVVDYVNSNPDAVIKLKEIEANKESELREFGFLEVKAVLEDRQNSRQHNIDIQKSTDWLVRNTGSLIAVATILFAFVLDIIILNQAFNEGIETLNPVVTLIAGYSSARAIQVLGFYFGDSKVNADQRRVS